MIGKRKITGGSNIYKPIKLSVHGEVQRLLLQWKLRWTILLQVLVGIVVELYGKTNKWIFYWEPVLLLVLRSIPPALCGHPLLVRRPKSQLYNTLYRNRADLCPGRGQCLWYRTLCGHLDIHQSRRVRWSRHSEYWMVWRRSHNSSACQEWCREVLAIVSINPIGPLTQSEPEDPE